jgi:sestrin
VAQGWHPSFLSAYTQTLHFILYDNGPLPIIWRHYLAVVAVWLYHCDSLQALYEHEFIVAGGDITWLKSIENAPKKLQSLLELNAILAHQPWLITKEEIAVSNENGRNHVHGELDDVTMAMLQYGRGMRV